MSLSSDGMPRRADPLGLVSETGVERPLVMKFGGSLVEQLGAQLYPSVTSTVAELISNAWDADAKSVWITIPFDEDWNDPSAEIVVLDDGHGMSRDDAQHTYLVVGRKKRLGPLGDRSEGGRPVHGRKGIGKLAAFGTAGYLECTSLRDGRLIAFGIDYDELRRLNPDQNYFVDVVRDPARLVAPSGEVLEHGTRVRLTGLRMKRKISEQSFLVSMSRRFALRGMDVLINGKALKRFDIPLKYRLPRDLAPKGVAVDPAGWGVESLPSGDIVRWWIGFTEKPLIESDQQGISVLARNKMAQRPFKFERAQGTTAQLGYEYLVGEVEADWLDVGEDIDTDLIQSNRDQLQLENPRLDEFVSWGRTRLAWALRARQELRERDLAAQNDADQGLNSILAETSGRERRALAGVVKQMSRLPEIAPSDLKDLLRNVVDSREEARLRSLVRDIAESESAKDPELWALVEQAGAIDARRLVGILQARLGTLAKVRDAVDRSLDLEEIADRIRRDTWILDPRWSLFAEPVEVTDSKDKDANFGGLIALRPLAPAPADEFVLVQLIVGAAASASDLEKFRRRVAAVAARHRHAAVDGLLVAPSFDLEDAAVSILSSRHEGGRLRAKTWEAAVGDSIAKHQAWLSVSERRGTKGNA